jgi:probable rRNA maturation factor
MTTKVSVQRGKRGLGFPQAAGLIKKTIKAALSAENIGCPCLVNVMLTDNEGIREINLAQRGIDSATDVLSFPMNELTPGEFDEQACEFDYEQELVMLGDMVISLERCAQQATEFGHSFEREVSYLTAHSVLHLLGYDHMDEGEQKKLMRSREDAIMELMGL